MDLIRHILLNDEPGAAGGGAPAAAPPAPPAAPAGDAPPAAPAGDAPPAPAAAPPAATDNPFASLPDNWRSSLLESAGFEGEEVSKRAGQLERVVDMGTLVKNYFNAQDKIRKGELSTGLPENPTDDQLAEWRAANGVPDTPDNYELALDDGLVLGEDDERIMTDVFAVAHRNNVPSTVMNEMVNTMMTARQREEDSIRQQDGIHMQQTRQQLKTAWGADMETNINMVRGLLNKLPGDLKSDFEGARLPDGRGVFNSPEMMVFLADIARELNPAGALVPNANNPTQAIADEIATLEKRMGEPDWHTDKAAQERYMKLLDARERYAQQA